MVGRSPSKRSPGNKGRWERLLAVVFSCLSVALGLGCTVPSEHVTDQQPRVIPSIENELSVEEAYRAIPHRRTVARLGELDLTPVEREYLSVVFRVIDSGVVLRVSTLQEFSKDDGSGASYFVDQARLLSFLNELTPPDGLEGYHQLLIEAFEAQRVFFVEWKREGTDYVDLASLGTNDQVVAASRALQSAYASLMSRYPGASPQNKTSFFDYHCALDFL